MLNITVNKNSLKLPVIVAKVVLTQEAHNKYTLSLSDPVCFNDLYASCSFTYYESY